MTNKYSKFTSQFIKIEKPNREQLLKAKKVLDVTSDAYYNSSDTLLPDTEWDKLYHHFTKFAKYTAGAKAKRGKKLINVGHIFPELVGTLDKTNFVFDADNKDGLDVNTVQQWFDSKDLDPNTKLKIAITPKVDGNSVSGTEDSTKLVSMLTRGKDGEGADMTDMFTDYRLGIDVPANDLMGVKYEAIVLDKDFETASDTIGKSFANNRSITAGILNSSDGDKYKEFITLIPLRINYKDTPLTREDELKVIDSLEKDYKYPITIIEGTIFQCLKKIKTIYQKYIDTVRTQLDYPIDGIVIEILNEDIRQSLGRSDDRNNFDFALKFPYAEQKSKVIDIKFYPSKKGTGRYTPVVVFEDCVFNGAVCNHVSIANYKRFKELNLAVGDEVIISYRNDVLSYLSVDSTCTKSGNPPIKFINKCIVCGSKLVLNKNKTFVSCSNDNCDLFIKGKLVNWFTKLGIKGVKENTINDLVEHLEIGSIPELYELTVDKIMSIEGYLQKSSENIIKAINSRKEIYDWELLGSLGIENIGRKTCKLILKEYTLDTLMDNKNFNSVTFQSQLCNVDGVSDITASTLMSFIEGNIELINKIKKYITIKSFQDELASSKSSASPTNFVFTGFRDPALITQLENAGHSVKSSVSKNTDVLVIKSKGSGSSKEKTAIDLGKTIYSLDEFKAVLNQYI